MCKRRKEREGKEKMIKNYYGCNKCQHCFTKGFLRKSDNKILRSPKTKEQRKAMIWWVGSEQLRSLKESLAEGEIEFYCDSCKAFVNSIRDQVEKE